MTETSMVADLLHTLQIFSQSGGDHVGVNLRPGAILDAPLSVQEPLWNSVIGGFGEDIADLVDLLLGEVTSSSVGVNLSDPASEDGESSADTCDLTEGEADLVLAVNVGVHHTEKVLELRSTS